MYRTPRDGRSPPSLWPTAIAGFWLMTLSVLAASAAPALNQEKINEAAAYQLDAYLKVKDAPALRLTHETAAEYLRRLEGYESLLERAYTSVEAARTTATHLSSPPANAVHWKRIESDAKHLDLLISAYRKTLHSQAHPDAGATLTNAKRLLWDLYSGLRDLRP